MRIPIGEEVATYIDFDQFIPGQSQDTCGFAATVLNHFATERGKPYGASLATVQQTTALYYAKFDGPDIVANTSGMTLPQLYQLIVNIGNHYQNLFPDGGVSVAEWKAQVGQWTAAGYPLIIAVAEDSVFDVGLGAKPYAWDTTGLSHIITVTGMATSGNVLVRDTANVGRPGPREYDLSKLAIMSATVFVPSWMPRPAGVTAPQAVDYQEQAALAEWNALASLVKLLPAPAIGISLPPFATTSNIYARWLSDYKAHTFHGPPVFGISTVDWNGNPIVVLYCLGARIEDRNGAITVYTLR